ncbi:hypothetical protein [Kordia sp.]|uniref:hypothetical protein n=1 Tax=Kordia sp. TaxID=1965332 RepID=UPI003B5BA748
MKTRLFFLFTILSLLFFACKQKVKTISEKAQQQEVSKDTVSQKVNSDESPIEKKINLNSKLKRKISRLIALEHHYQLKSLEIVSTEKAVLFGRLQRILKLKDTIKSVNITVFKKELHEVRKAFLKGTKPMKPNGNTYPRVTVEEYVFKTPESATTVYEMLKNSKGKSSVWTYISKAPHELILEEHRMYFVESGGFYMMDIYEDIVEKVKN